MTDGLHTLKPKMYIGITLFIMGIIFLFTGLSISAEAENFRENAGETIAYVSEIDDRRVRGAGWDKYERRVYVSYTVDGQHYEEKLKGSTKDMKELDVFRIHYDPDNPCEVRTTDYTGGADHYPLISAALIISGAVTAVSCMTGKKQYLSDSQTAENSAEIHDFR